VPWLPVLDQAGYAGIATLPTAAATATDLMVFKMLFNRRKYWADIESLLRCGAADTAEAAEWVASILGPDDPRLAQLQQITDELAEEVAGRDTAPGPPGPKRYPDPAARPASSAQ
jgi:hypothetical protein